MLKHKLQAHFHLLCNNKLRWSKQSPRGAQWNERVAPSDDHSFESRLLSGNATTTEL